MPAYSLEKNNMVDVLKPHAKTLFHGKEVQDGEEIGIPLHNRVDAFGRELSEVCPSTTGIVIVRGGVPTLKAEVRCKNAEEQTCFFLSK